MSIMDLLFSYVGKSEDITRRKYPIPLIENEFKKILIFDEKINFFNSKAFVKSS